MILVGE